MTILKKFQYPLFALILITFIVWGYFAFVRVGHDPALVGEVQFVVDRYIDRLETIQSVRLESDLFQREDYLSLSNEFDRPVQEVELGKANPFSSL